MAGFPHAGAAIAKRDAVAPVAPESTHTSHPTPCPRIWLACWLEGFLEAAADHEGVENLLLGLGTAALCLLLGYAIVVLAKFQGGLLSIALG